MKKIILVFLALFMFGCEKLKLTENELLDNSINNSIVEINSDDDFIKIGEKLDNPYSLKNMRFALSSLNLTDSKIKLDANFLYLKIESSDEKSAYILENTKDLNLFKYPLDYKIIKNGKAYKEDGSIDQLQVYWAAVPINYKFPDGIKTKLLEELFLPFGDGNEKYYLPQYETSFLKKLELKSLELFDTEYKKNNKARVNAVPDGIVNVWYDYLQTLISIPGVTVKMKRWFTTKYAITNSEGYYSTTYNFNGPVDFTIQWKNPYFEIKENIYNAETGQNNISGSWNINIYKSGNSNSTGFIFNTDDFAYGHMYRAAYNYYYNNTTYGIKKPPLPNSTVFGSGLINIKRKTAPLTGSSHFFFTNGGGLVDPSAVIQVDPNSAASTNARRIFATTTHELAHASHWDLGMKADDYLNSKKMATLAESWAMGVEWVITNDVYKKLANSLGYYYTNWERPDQATQPKPINFWLLYNSGSFVSSSRDDFYTPLFIDLIDDENQNTAFSATGIVNNISYPYSSPPNDISKGFTISLLESYLAASPKSWLYMKSAVISGNTTTSSNSNIAYLFDTYEN